MMVKVIIVYCLLLLAYSAAETSEDSPPSVEEYQSIFQLVDDNYISKIYS